MNKSDITWVAGLLEGNGCFFEQKGYVGIRTNMSDLDVLERACQVTGVGRVVGPYNKTGKPVYTWNVSPECDAVWLMERVLPYMGERRTTRINELLALYDEKMAA